MADPSTAPPLIPSSIRNAHAKITQYIHRTALITNRSLNRIASSPDPAVFLSDNPPPFLSEDGAVEGVPQFRIWMKCENQQKIGAFKARGAFHAVTRLVDEMGLDEVRRRGVVTHSSGESALFYLRLSFLFFDPLGLVWDGPASTGLESKPIYYPSRSKFRLESRLSCTAAPSTTSPST